MRKLIIFFLLFILASCKKEIDPQLVEEFATAKPTTASKCFTVCDINKYPDMQIVTNIEEDTLFADGSNPIDSSAYFWTRFHRRAEPVRLTQNHIATAFEALYYEWVGGEGELINKVGLQCLYENIAPFDPTCKNDWVFNESQGKLVNGYYEFEGLFEFEIYEQGNGNNWKLFHRDYKKRFYPSAIPAQDYVFNTNFCYYYGSGQRALQAQMGDFYWNYFRFPPRDGIFKLIIKSNPLNKGCRAIQELRYDNNDKTFIIEIKEGKFTVLSKQ